MGFRGAWRWLGTTSFRRSNQNALIWFRIRPLSGIPFAITTSNAEMRSVATISNSSPRSITSRTFPIRAGGNPHTAVCSNSGIGLL